MNSALIIGHAGHELKVLKFIQLFRPLVFVLTDGSGTNGVSRIESTRKIVEYFGCRVSPVFGYFTDTQIYEHILTGTTGPFVELRNKIQRLLIAHDIDTVFGDACEGFNPSHDLCRYMINNCVSRIAQLPPYKTISNYDFLLSSFEPQGHFKITLDENDKQSRDALINAYPEIKHEIELAKKHAPDESVFNYESIRKVTDVSLKKWTTDAPFYETYAQKKIREGKYSSIITFGHLKNIEKHLNS